MDTLNFVMESLACGHTVMGHRDAHAAMVAVADTVTLEEVNALARSMLTFSSDYGHEGEVGGRGEGRTNQRVGGWEDKRCMVQGAAGRARGRGGRDSRKGWRVEG